jgi:hypothetical protein
MSDRVDVSYVYIGSNIRIKAILPYQKSCSSVKLLLFWQKNRNWKQKQIPTLTDTNVPGCSKLGKVGYGTIEEQHTPRKDGSLLKLHLSSSLKI